MDILIPTVLYLLAVYVGIRWAISQAEMGPEDVDMMTPEEREYWDRELNSD